MIWLPTIEHVLLLHQKMIALGLAVAQGTASVEETTAWIQAHID